MRSTAPPYVPDNVPLTLRPFRCTTSSISGTSERDRSQRNRSPRSASRGLLGSSSMSSRFGSDQERRRRRSKMLYEFEMALREEGAASDFVYDEEQDLFRFPDDSRFALSRARAAAATEGNSPVSSLGRSCSDTLSPFVALSPEQPTP